ncbi:MAG: alpha-ketoacid dehydrogenase subunit beta, partial [Candidatus Micrarchaeota archaeon]|nr:alpha-ketoacid dehydrogenase subunit beta [Candidatus Micrarchaeota archaeon]
MNMVSAINNALELSMKENDNIVLLGEDIGKDGGVFRVTDGLQAKFGEERVFDTPLSESGIIG